MNAADDDRSLFIERWRDRQCTGKHQFKRRRDAKAHAKHVGRAVEAYYCQWCKGWHVGHARR